MFDGVKRMDYDEAVKAGLIEVLGAETDEKFLSNVMEQVNDKAVVEKMADTFTMVYTPLPRHRPQAHPRSPAPPGHEARDLRPRADGH